MPEPGRRVIAEERNTGGHAVPWCDLAAFGHRALDMARQDLDKAANLTGTVFFDRGVIDAAVALNELTGMPVSETLGSKRAYSDPVFLAPPWPEIFEQDAERQHGFDAAVAEYERLSKALPQLGYRVRHLPKSSVDDRVRFMLAELNRDDAE